MELTAEQEDFREVVARFMREQGPTNTVRQWLTEPLGHDPDMWRRMSGEFVPAGSIGKLAASLVARQASHVHTLISGSEALFEGEDCPLEGVIAEVLLSTPAISIAGGTDEIESNIIAERVLGMPQEPRMDTGPFRDVPRNVNDPGGSGS